MDLAKYWINQCMESHRTCGTSSNMISPPTRLIHVKGENNISLYSTTDGDMKSYLALSYCWGDGPRFLTLVANHKEHARRIPFEALPQTFKDAVRVSYRLGYHYLWIDALCIIQDCPTDTAKELSRMGDIYRGAVFTIYAEGARSAHSGIFVARNALSYKPCTLAISTTIETGTTSETITVATTCNGTNFLETRGWVLQEEILSSRVLIFGKQMAWKCTAASAEETRPTPRTMHRSNKHIEMRLSLYTGDHSIAHSTSAGHRQDHFRLWYTMVEGYTRRHLSFTSDALPALSGIATLFSTAHRVKYLAGLWREDLVAGLSWYISSNDYREAPKTRNKDDRAKMDEIDASPTWTWSSVKNAMVKFRVQPSYEDFNNMFEVVEASCVPQSQDNAYGKVGSGQLKLRAPLAKILVQCSHEYTIARTQYNYGVRDTGINDENIEKKENPRFPGLIVEAGSGTVIGDVALDLLIDDCLKNGDGLLKDRQRRANFEPDMQMEAWYLILYTHRIHSKIRATVMVLQQVKDSPPEYQRLGLGMIAGLSEQLIASMRREVCHII
jgi:hypothetical protein